MARKLGRTSSDRNHKIALVDVKKTTDCPLCGGEVEIRRYGYSSQIGGLSGDGTFEITETTIDPCTGQNSCDARCNSCGTVFPDEEFSDTDYCENRGFLCLSEDGTYHIENGRRYFADRNNRLQLNFQLGSRLAKSYGVCKSMGGPKMISLVDATPQTRCIKCGGPLHIITHGYASSTSILEDTGKLTKISIDADLEPDWFSACCSVCDTTYHSLPHVMECHGSGHVVYNEDDTYSLIPGRKYHVDEDGRIELRIKYSVRKEWEGNDD